MITDRDIEARVAHGVAYLDRLRPGWADQVDLERLQLNDCMHCVLGQLAKVGGFWTACSVLGLTVAEAVACGFLLAEADFEGMEVWATHAPHLTLQATWEAVIRARQPARAPEPAEAPALAMVGEG